MRGKADEQSDVDLPAGLEPGRSLLNQGALLADLQKVPGSSVGVATERGLKERTRARMLKEAVPL